MAKFQAIVVDGWQLGWQRRAQCEDPQGIPYTTREWKAATLDHEMVERACRAYDDDWYEGKDHTTEGAETWDLMDGILRAALSPEFRELDRASEGDR